MVWENMVPKTHEKNRLVHEKKWQGFEIPRKKLDLYTSLQIFVREKLDLYVVQIRLVRKSKYFCNENFRLV